jgi:hypothetical protein
VSGPPSGGLDNTLIMLFFTYPIKGAAMLSEQDLHTGKTYHDVV